MNWFGKKKDVKTPSAVASTSNHRPTGGGGGASRTATANTVVNLRENIATQEKRWVGFYNKLLMHIILGVGDKTGKFILRWLSSRNASGGRNRLYD